MVTTPDLPSPHNPNPHLQGGGPKAQPAPPTTPRPNTSNNKPGRRHYQPRNPPNHRRYNATDHNMFLNNGVPFPDVPLRSFEELHAERTYLLKALQTQNEQATELLRKIADIEETTARVQRNSDRKRLNKKLTYYKAILRETTLQEKSILARLGDLTYEIQVKDRLKQIEAERRHHELILNQMNMTMWQNMAPSQVDPTMPFFFPPAHPIQYLPWEQQEYENDYAWPIYPYPSPYYTEFQDQIPQYQGPMVNIPVPVQNWQQMQQVQDFDPNNNINRGSISVYVSPGASFSRGRAASVATPRKSEKSSSLSSPTHPKQQVRRTASLNLSTFPLRRLTFPASNPSDSTISVLSRTSAPSLGISWGPVIWK